MNDLQLSRMKASFWHRRYAIRLGKRYVSAAAGVIILGMLGCSKVNNINSPVTQSLLCEQQQFHFDG